MSLIGSRTKARRDLQALLEIKDHGLEVAGLGAAYRRLESRKLVMRSKRNPHRWWIAYEGARRISDILLVTVAPSNLRVHTMKDRG